ncbi:hypothetical protein [Pseudobdellovibrio exovorus]|uniref:WYL domain-containing protein n=1 Tax=Pseudobdellovibrio exovorus JSS TaxID=1184267 RepID=M4V852_9BACT|nr:hypothetical protein [Pseudobdellovibrio exovorus]AGH95393.1 hypothetical protein A11Q_1177 [Pseudobdellovibrio exovorus JSS]
MNQIIVDAINNKKMIEFKYNGGVRIVEPHCYGISTAGNESLRAYQVDGYSSSDPKDMKLFTLSKASDISLLEKHFDGPRPEYVRGDSAMSHIYCEL